MPEFKVSHLLLHPLPEPASIEKLVFTAKDVTTGALTLQCLAGGFKVSALNGLANSRVYCFAGALPAVRIFEDETGSRTSFNGIVRFNGHYLARQIRSTTAKGDFDLNIDVEQVEPMAVIDEAMFVPPPDAKLNLHRSTDFGAAIEAGHLLTAKMPVFPAAARLMGREGTVVLRGVVTTDGSMKDLAVVGGPLILQQAAIDAVKTWRYSPFLLAGEPIEVETQVDVVFAHSN